MPGLTALILGAAAGGGFPQWNCGCALCQLVRSGDPRVRPSTQFSVAVSGNDTDWLIIGASPDIRQQLNQTPRLWPTGARTSPINGVVLLGGDIDAMGGLLTLRERQPFTIYAGLPLLFNLRENPMFGVLDHQIVSHYTMIPNHSVTVTGDLTITLVTMPGKVPLYLEQSSLAIKTWTYGVRIEAHGHTLIVAPACAEITDDVLATLRGADVVMFDGTLFTDDELIVGGLGTKTGRRMGHVPVCETVDKLASITARRILIHVNNSNPLWLSDSPERKQVEAAGFEVAYDGMEVIL